MPDEPSSISPPRVSAEERQRLLRLAYRFCWDVQDAEDVLHNALLAATRHDGQLRDAGSRWGWLRRIVVQHCHLHARRRQAERLRTQGAAERAVSENKAQQGASQTRALSSEELGTLMKRMLVRLPEKQRIAMTLRHLEQMEYTQIAEIMRVSESTVRAHVRSGRDALRRMILARHPEWQP